MFRITTIAALAIAFAAPASAVTISAYDTVNGPSVSAGISGAGVTSADLTRGAGVAQIGNANNFRSRFWTVGGDAATALDNEDFLEWGFTSTTTYDLDTLSLRYDRNDNGPQAIAILASIDGGAFTQIFEDLSVSTASEIANIDLTGISANSATFRLVGWDADTAGGRFWLRNNGVGPGNDFGIILTAIPLPAGLPLLAGGLAVLGLSRRKT